MVYDLDAAAIAYKKAVVTMPSSERLEELIWQAVDPESKVEAKPKNVDDPRVTYEKLCLELTDHQMTIAPHFTHVAHRS